MTKRAVVYARVSTKEQDTNFSIPSQIEGAKEYARRHDMQVVGIYNEDASGLAYPRPKLEEALRKIENGEADTLIAHVEDRLNRHEINGFLIRKRIADAKGELHYTLSGPCNLGDEHRMFAMIKDAIAANEIRTITERMQRGKRHKAKQGAWVGMGIPPYGYRVVGEGLSMRLEIVEEEACWVRQIFEWYAYDKISVVKIAERLVESGVARPGARRAHNKNATTSGWNTNTIYRILQNETYAGRFYAYRWIYSGKRAREERPREDWIEIPVPALIDNDLFAAAELRLSNARTDMFRKRRYEYLMATRLTCGICGYKLSTMPAGRGQWMYYRCYAYRDRTAGVKCALPLFKVQSVDAIVWEHIKLLIRNPEQFQRAAEETRAQSRQDHNHLYDAIASIEEEIKRQQARLERAVRLYIDSEGDDEKFVRETAKRTQEEINQILTNLHLERDALSYKIAEVRISDDTLAAINMYVSELQDGLDEMSLEERQSVIEALGATARLAHEDGQRVVYLTVLLQEVRIDFETGKHDYLTSDPNLKKPLAIPLTFRLILAA